MYKYLYVDMITDEDDDDMMWLFNAEKENLRLFFSFVLFFFSTVRNAAGLTKTHRHIACNQSTIKTSDAV